MDPTIIISLLLVLGIVLIFWFLLGHFSLKNQMNELNLEWQEISSNLRKRQDMVPLLIELARLHVTGQEELFEKLIQERAHSYKEHEIGTNKVEREHDLTREINKVIDLGKIFPALGKDFNFLELRKNFQELDENLHAQVAKYNDIVRYYNKRRSAWYLIVISQIFRHKKVQIFDI